jgi:CII-binding regulator of phage lambda lysogenization HflD
MVYKGGMVEVVETLETKLKRHEDALVACMAEITRLREENARLRSSENTAHSVLREVYNDPTASPAVRVADVFASAHPARVTIPSHTLRAVRRVPPCVRQRSLAS